MGNIKIRYGFCISLILVGILSRQSYAQQVNNVLQTLQELKNLQEYGYSYKINMNFPDGQLDSISGETFTSPTKGIVYNSSDMSTIFYNGNLYYNANHIDKNVTIYKMNKRFNQVTADSLQTGVFQMFLYKDWMDSVIIKYGQISGALVSKGIISFDINFPANVTIRKISIQYDMAKKIPIRIQVIALASEDEDGKTISIITCTKYSKKFDEKKLDYRSYFETTANDKYVLNKYKNYKLFTLK